MLLAVKLVKALIAELRQIGKRRNPLGELEFWQMVLSKREFHIAPLGNADGIVIRLLKIRKQHPHLLLGFDVVFLAAKAHPVGVVHGLAHLHAHENILHLRVLAAQIVRVVRHNHRKARLPRDAPQAVVDLALLGEALILQFQIEIPLAENFGVFQRRLLRRRIVVVVQILRHSAHKARREADQSLVVLAQQIHIHARAVVKALDKAAGDHIAEIAVAGFVLAQQNQMIRLAVKRVYLVKARARRDIDFAPDDGLDARGLRRAVEVDHAVHDAVVGDGNRLLPDLLYARHQIADAARAVQQAVFRMQMQMDKTHNPTPLLTARSAFASGD